MKRAELRAALKPLADLERLVNRVLAGLAQPRDLLAIRDTLGQNSIYFGSAARVNEVQLPESGAMDEAVVLCNPPSTTIPATLQNTGIIRAGYSQELDSVVDASKTCP